MRWAWVSTALFVMAGAVSAADLTDLRSEYSLQSWDERHGLPSGRIWAITQDSKGFFGSAPRPD